MKNMQERKTTAESSGKYTETDTKVLRLCGVVDDDDSFTNFHSVNTQHSKAFANIAMKLIFGLFFVRGKFRGFFLIYFYV